MKSAMGFLTAATFKYTLRAGITAAAGTRRGVAFGKRRRARRTLRSGIGARSFLAIGVPFTRGEGGFKVFFIKKKKKKLKNYKFINKLKIK
jgi:hypothetical protein